MENMGNLSLTVTDLIQAKPDEEAVISILTKVDDDDIYIMPECISISLSLTEKVASRIQGILSFLLFPDTSHIK